MRTVDILIGSVVLLIWGALCGVPAMTVYNLAMRARTGWRTWLILGAVLVLWMPLVTGLCLWGVSLLIGPYRH